jgi:uncharacterized membrane protein YphA (DoxX/SURF4 family)
MIPVKDFLILLIRLFLGYLFVSAGFCKLTHGNFGQLMGPPWLEEGLAKYGLAMFARVVAYSQILCGVLLLSQRFSLLGAIMLVPMNIAILAVTVSMNWQGTPYVNAGFLLLNMLLIIYEWPKLRFLLQDGNYTITSNALDGLRSSRLNIAGMSLFLPAVLFASTGFYKTAAFVFCAGLITLAIPLLRVSRFSVIQKLMIIQSIGNMLMVTLAFKNQLVLLAFGLNTALLALILLGWIISKSKKKEPVVPAPENCFI